MINVCRDNNGKFFASCVDDLRVIQANYTSPKNPIEIVKYVRYINSINITNEDYDIVAEELKKLQSKLQSNELITGASDVDLLTVLSMLIGTKLEKIGLDINDYVTQHINNYGRLNHGLKIDSFVDDYDELISVINNSNEYSGIKDLLVLLGNNIITCISDNGIILDAVMVDDVRISGMVSIPVYEDCVVASSKIRIRKATDVAIKTGYQPEVPEDLYRSTIINNPSMVLFSYYDQGRYGKVYYGYIQLPTIQNKYKNIIFVKDLE